MRYIFVSILWVMIIQATAHGHQTPESTGEISTHSVLFNDADLVAVVEFGSVGTFTVKEFIFPTDTSEFPDMLKYKGGEWSGVYLTATYPESEDARSPIVFLNVPYLVFLKVMPEISKKENQVVFQSVHGRHGCLPLIDMDRRLEFEGVRDFYARLWYGYTNGNSHYIYTPDAIVEDNLLRIMKADYGTVDGTAIHQAILGIKDLYLAEDGATRSKIIQNEELWQNPVFRYFFTSVVNDVSLKSKKI